MHERHVHVDPLGRVIVLHDHTWHGHILVDHPEIVADRDLAGSAIGSPIRIAFSTSDANCRRHYGQGPRPGVMMHVVADISLGLVKTAFLVKRFSGGAEEWSSPTP
jgi:hypothetical protein